MSRAGCLREPEVLDTVAEGRWPDACDAELADHVLECEPCADLIEVAVVLSDDREAALRASSVPGSGVAWWRIQMRMRRDALRASRRMVTAAQSAVLGAGVIVALVALSMMWAPSREWPGWIGPLRDAVEAGSVARLIQWSTPVALVFLGMITLIPIAAYVMLRDD